jgi:hypothetical protein
MQTCWCFRLSDEELVLAKRVHTFIQRPRGAVLRPSHRPPAPPAARRRSAARAALPAAAARAAGFAQLAPLLGCSEKSPRQARADSFEVDHPRDYRKVIGADGALIERRRQSGRRSHFNP